MVATPVIIQGGMGAGVFNWQLARAVSFVGQLGVVSGVALDTILALRLRMKTADRIFGRRSTIFRSLRAERI